MKDQRLHIMRLLTRLEGRVPALHSVLTRSHARRFDALAPKWDAIRSDVEDSRRMLEYAALLHDIGSIIAHERHTEHAHYIIKNGGNVTYVVYPDEGHGFARPENRIDFNARAEAFLGAYLGGRTEPVTGGKIPGSTAEVRTIEKGKAIRVE